MASTESRIPATIDALVALWSGNGFNVWDGPILSGDYSDAVFVGYDGDPEGEQRAVTGTQQWAGIGAKRRAEDFDVAGAICVLVGDTDTSWKPARDRVFAMVTALGQSLRANPSLGQTPPFVAELIPGELFQENTSAGYQARLLFTVHVTSRV